MDTITEWWRTHVTGGNINKSIADVHAKYGKLEYLLPALYLLYCLILMQCIAKSFEALGGFKRAAVVTGKLLFVHAVLTVGAIVVVSQFSESAAAQLLTHFFSEQLPSGFVAVIIPLGCMLIAFLFAMLRKLFSKE